MFKKWKIRLFRRPTFYLKFQPTPIWPIRLNLILSTMGHSYKTEQFKISRPNHFKTKTYIILVKLKMWPYPIFHLLATIITLSPYSLCSTSIWSDVFADTALTIIFTPNCDKLSDLDADLSDFQPVWSHNSYSPLRQILYCNNLSGPIIIDETITWKWNPPTDKSPRQKSSFVRIHNSPHDINIAIFLRCEYLILFANEVARPEYIFGQTSPHRDAECFKRAAKLIGSAKLILFEDNFTTPLLLPCLTCSPTAFSKFRDRLIVRHPCRLGRPK